MVELGSFSRSEGSLDEERSVIEFPCVQGSKCEEWKDEKKGSATVLYTQIINSQLVYTVHGTHFAEGSAAP